MPKDEYAKRMRRHRELQEETTLAVLGRVHQHCPPGWGLELAPRIEAGSGDIDGYTVTMKNPRSDGNVFGQGATLAEALVTILGALVAPVPAVMPQGGGGRFNLREGISERHKECPLCEGDGRVLAERDERYSNDWHGLFAERLTELAEALADIGKVKELRVDTQEHATARGALYVAAAKVLGVAVDANILPERPAGLDFLTARCSGCGEDHPQAEGVFCDECDEKVSGVFDESTEEEPARTCTIEHCNAPAVKSIGDGHYCEEHVEVVELSSEVQRLVDKHKAAPPEEPRMEAISHGEAETVDVFRVPSRVAHSSGPTGREECPRCGGAMKRFGDPVPTHVRCADCGYETVAGLPREGFVTMGNGTRIPVEFCYGEIDTQRDGTIGGEPHEEAGCDEEPEVDAGEAPTEEAPAEDDEGAEKRPSPDEAGAQIRERLTTGTQHTQPPAPRCFCGGELMAVLDGCMAVKHHECKDCGGLWPRPEDIEPVVQSIDEDYDASPLTMEKRAAPARWGDDLLSIERPSVFVHEGALSRALQPGETIEVKLPDLLEVDVLFPSGRRFRCRGFVVHRPEAG
jgi:hypothetical protein